MQLLQLLGIIIKDYRWGKSYERLFKNIANICETRKNIFKNNKNPARFLELLGILKEDKILPGNVVYLSFEPKAMHFFDPEDEKNLLAGPNAVNSKGPIILPSETPLEELPEEKDDAELDKETKKAKK